MAPQSILENWRSFGIMKLSCRLCRMNRCMFISLPLPLCLCARFCAAISLPLLLLLTNVFTLTLFDLPPELNAIWITMDQSRKIDPWYVYVEVMLLSFMKAKIFQIHNDDVNIMSVKRQRAGRGRRHVHSARRFLRWIFFNAISLDIVVPLLW